MGIRGTGEQKWEVVAERDRQIIREWLEDQEFRRRQEKLFELEGRMRYGDWICMKCNDLQFRRNIRCRICKQEKPEEVE